MIENECVQAAFTGTWSYWFLQMVAMLLTALLIPHLRITSIFGALGMVAALAFLNATVWDAALFFHVPDALTTHVLLLFLVNGVIFWILVKLLPGIEVEGIVPALVAPVVFMGLSLLIDTYGREVDWVAVLNWTIEKMQVLRDFFLEQSESARSSES